MTHDWWWPWWISTAFDLGVAALALVALARARRRSLRLVLALALVAAIVAAVLAPVVMKHPNHRMPSMEQQMKRGMP
jgi:tellurite resistance protein TehA-like permease